MNKQINVRVNEVSQTKELVRDLAATIESNLMTDRFFQRGTATMIEVVAVKFDFESDKLIATTLQTTDSGSGYYDVEIDNELQRLI